MAFPESFWVAAATVAPVIALANAVTASDCLGVPDLDALTRSLPPSSPIREQRLAARGATFLFCAAALSIVNLGIQTIILITALNCLAFGLSLPIQPIIAGGALGLVILLPVGLFTGQANRIRIRIEEAVRNLEEIGRQRAIAEQAAEIITRTLGSRENSPTHSCETKKPRWRVWRR